MLITNIKKTVRKGQNLLSALAKEAADGFKRSDPETARRRGEICLACELWNPSGNFGLGECGDERCGCTKFKKFFAAQTCPRGKW